MLMLSRGSAYEIAFAAQMHENRGRVPRFSYFQREKVSARDLSDARVLESQNKVCRKTEDFDSLNSFFHSLSISLSFSMARFSMRETCTCDTPTMRLTCCCVKSRE